MGSAVTVIVFLRKSSPALSSVPAARLEMVTTTPSRFSRRGRPARGRERKRKKTLAELLVETLVSREVSRIYGVAGDSLNGITDSIRRQDQLRWLHVRHEETAAFAAGAEAHLTGPRGKFQRVTPAPTPRAS